LIWWRWRMRTGWSCCRCVPGFSDLPDAWVFLGFAVAAAQDMPGVLGLAEMEVKARLLQLRCGVQV
jgi:hypothetical protein